MNNINTRQLGVRMFEAAYE